MIKFANRVPRCTDAKSYEVWHDIARTALPGKCGFCTDCTPEFADARRYEGTCEHPEIIFVLIDDMVEGVFPSRYNMNK